MALDNGFGRWLYAMALGRGFGKWLLAMALGMAIPPLVSGELHEHVGFRLMCTYISFVVIAFALAYFMCAQGWEAVTTTIRDYHGEGKPVKAEGD